MAVVRTSKKTKKEQSSASVPTQATVPMEFRKTNEAIGLRVREGKLSLLTRKIFNVMMYHAQEQRIPGINAPIDTPAAKKYFWIPLSNLARDAAYDSKDTEFLKKQLEELQNIKLLMETERQWTSERLVSSITIVNPQGFKKHGGQVWFGFSFPPEVHELVMAPGTYTRFSLLYQGMLRSGSALALYEICRRYATNPSKVTLIETYEHWYGALTGNPVLQDELPEYKYFKRDVIKTAMAEINALTDIQVELIEHKNGRRVEQLQFRVEHSKQSQLEFAVPAVIDLELIGKIMRLGFTQQEASDFVAQYSDDKIRAAVGFVQARIEQKNSPVLDSPAAYFRWTLKQGASAAQELRSQKTAAKKGASNQENEPTVMEKFLAARALDSLAVYKELEDEERRVIFSRFKEQNTNKMIKLDHGVDNALTRSVFTFWYAKELWGDPSIQDVVNFVDKVGLLARQGDRN